MTTRKLLLLIFTAAVFTACMQMQQRNAASRVVYFHYGGYGDTLYATLEGQVFYLDTLVKSKDSLTALPGVTIQMLESGKLVSSAANGQFIFHLSKGVFSFLVTKEGFQPLLVKNYVSDPDQFSGTKIYLEKGDEQQEFVIPAGGLE